MKRFLHIVLLLAVALSCRGPRLIPKDTLEDMYVDMFLLDQQIIQTPGLRNQADTMLVYEPVFNKYGYDTDDYLFTVRTNLKDPERFAKVLENVVSRLDAESRVLEREIDHLNWESKFLGMKRPLLDSLLAPFSTDSLVLGVARAVRDSSSGAWFRLEAVQKDTLMMPVPADTVKVDTLKHE